METSTTDLTKGYVKEHPYIKYCLKRGLLNYSSVARTIAKDLGLGNKTSLEAIIVALRRMALVLKKEQEVEKDISALLSKSEISIKNKISVLILEKSASFESIEFLQREAKKNYCVFYILEGSDNYTIITQDRMKALYEKKLKSQMLKITEGLALINLKSPRDIETTCGVVAYLTSLFAQNGVNILEFHSCWTDTIFIISSRDIDRCMGFLNFQG